MIFSQPSLRLWTMMATMATLFSFSTAARALYRSPSSPGVIDGILFHKHRYISAELRLAVIFPSSPSFFASARIHIFRFSCRNDRPFFVRPPRPSHTDQNGPLNGFVRLQTFLYTIYFMILLLDSSCFFSYWWWPGRSENPRFNGAPHLMENEKLCFQ